MDWNVVDNFDGNSGKQCIEYLSEQIIGVAEVVLFSDIRGRPVD